MIISPLLETIKLAISSPFCIVQLAHHILKQLQDYGCFFIYSNIIISLVVTLILSLSPNQVSNSKIVSLLLETSNVFVFLYPQFNNFKDSELLKFFVAKPDTTAIRRLSFFFH